MDTEKETTSIDHTVTLWFCVVDDLPAEIEHCGDEDCARCDESEPAILELPAA